MSFEKDIILIKQLMGFLEVAKRGQIKQTAECIHMKQSNLSNLIKELEDELNLQLFNRHAHGVSLTSSGSYVFKIANDMYKTIADIEVLAKKTHIFGGTLKLWISEGICNSYIPACLNDFYVKFPQVHLEIISSLKDPESLCDIDLGIVYHEPHFNDAFVLSKGTFYFNLYASKQYLKNYGIPKNLEDLEVNHKICLRTDFENRWPEWKDLFKNAQNIVIRTDSSNILLNLVKNDLGISFLPSFVADDTLSEVLPDQVKAVQPYWIICPHHLKDVPKVRVLMEHIKQIVEKL